MKNKKANLSCVRTVLLQAGKGHAARTTIKQNNKTNINKSQKCIDSNSIHKMLQNIIRKNVTIDV